jgi:hypothetical protein
MSIALSQISGPQDPTYGGLAEMYRRVMLELKERAQQRLVSDARKLTAEAGRARLLEREVAQILRELDDEAAQWIAENIPKNYLKGMRRAELGFAEIGAGAGEVTPLVHQEAIQVLVNDLQDDLLDVTERMERGYRMLTRKTQLSAAQDKLITDKVARGIAEGKARREVSREIKKQLIDEYADKILINGKHYRIDQYAELVARTRTAAAQTAGTVNRVLDAGEDLVMVSNHGCDCDICAPYEGKVFSISGASNRYPRLTAEPPFHPNCKHGLAPFIEELASGAERRRAA